LRARHPQLEQFRVEHVEHDEAEEGPREPLFFAVTIVSNNLRETPPQASQRTSSRGSFIPAIISNSFPHFSQQ